MMFFHKLSFPRRARHRYAQARQAGKRESSVVNKLWIPAFARMTEKDIFHHSQNGEELNDDGL